MRYIIGDTETTGLERDKAACEIGLIEIDPHTLEVITEVGSILNPEKPIHPKASEIHGISDEEAAQHNTIAEFVECKLEGGFTGEITLIGYRVSFDAPLLKPIGNIVRTWDLLPLAQKLVPESANHKLQTMKEHFSLPGGEAHRALGDCHTTLQLLRVLIDLSGRPLAEHCNTKEYISTMPWGKHAGMPLVQVPISYRRWLLKEADIHIDLRSSLEMIAKTE
jgi:DNA polymerase-3 subunit epsilon